MFTSMRRAHNKPRPPSVQIDQSKANKLSQNGAIKRRCVHRKCLLHFESRNETKECSASCKVAIQQLKIYLKTRHLSCKVPSTRTNQPWLAWRLLSRYPTRGRRWMNCSSTGSPSPPRRTCYERSYLTSRMSRAAS